MIHISADEKSKKKEDQRKRDRRAEEKEGQRKRERGTEEKSEDQRRRERRTEEKGDQRKRGGRHVDNQKSKDKGASSKISRGDEPDLHDVLMNARDDLEPANKRIRPDDMTCTNLDEEDKVRII